jgi:hypothetical protein
MSVLFISFFGLKMCPCFSAKWRNEVLKSVNRFSSESIFTGHLYLEMYSISSLNDYFKLKKTPENDYLASSRLFGPYFKPNQWAGPTCLSSDIDRRQGARCTTCFRLGESTHDNIGSLLLPLFFNRLWFWIGTASPGPVSMFLDFSLSLSIHILLFYSYFWLVFINLLPKIP